MVKFAREKKKKRKNSLSINLNKPCDTKIDLGEYEMRKLQLVL
jgi:hypothetical protein